MPENEPTQAEVPIPGPKRWKSTLVAGLLIAAGLLHGFAPRRFALDWPTLALVLSGVLLIFIPMDEIGAIVESLEFGKAKILFRKVENLDRSVDEAAIEQSEIKRVQPSMSSVSTEKAETETFLSSDREMALVRIGIEMEKILADQYKAHGGPDFERAVSW